MISPLLAVERKHTFRSCRKAKADRKNVKPPAKVILDFAWFRPSMTAKKPYL